MCLDKTNTANICLNLFYNREIEFVFEFIIMWYYVSESNIYSLKDRALNATFDYILTRVHASNVSNMNRYH